MSGLGGLEVRRFALLGVLLSPLLGCGVSQDEEVELGRRNAEQVESQLPLVRDQIASNYVQALGVSIARTTTRQDLDWRFRIVDSRQINAFALPGGFIYVNRGLIERAEHLDELAGALAHEVGHVVLRHAARQIEKQTKTGVAVELGCRLTDLCNSDVARAAIQVGGAALFARYSRHDEAEADDDEGLDMPLYSPMSGAWYAPRSGRPAGARCRLAATTSSPCSKARLRR